MPVVVRDTTTDSPLPDSVSARAALARPFGKIVTPPLGVIARFALRSSPAPKLRCRSTDPDARSVMRKKVPLSATITGARRRAANSDASSSIPCATIAARLTRSRRTDVPTRGMATPKRMPTIVMTISTSISVKPRRVRRVLGNKRDPATTNSWMATKYKTTGHGHQSAHHSVTVSRPMRQSLISDGPHQVPAPRPPPRPP